MIVGWLSIFANVPTGSSQEIRIFANAERTDSEYLALAKPAPHRGLMNPEKSA
jgi:hypothetical protein